MVLVGFPALTFHKNTLGEEPIRFQFDQRPQNYIRLNFHLRIGSYNELHIVTLLLKFAMMSFKLLPSVSSNCRVDLSFVKLFKPTLITSGRCTVLNSTVSNSEPKETAKVVLFYLSPVSHFRIIEDLSSDLHNNWSPKT